MVMVFNIKINYMVAVNFIGRGNLSTQRKPTTWRNHWQEEFEDTKGVIRICKSVAEQTTQWPTEKGNKDKRRSTKHRKLKIEQHEPH